MATPSTSNQSLNGKASNIQSTMSQASKDVTKEAKDIPAALKETFGDLSETISERADEARELAQQFSDKTVTFVKENPLKVALSIAGLGVLLGAYISRKK